MGKIVIHAGMPKAGSSSVQEFLADNAARLRDQADIAVLIAQFRAEHRDPVLVRPFASGDAVNSGQLYERYFHQPSDREAIVSGLLRGLDRLASEHDAVVVTSEAFAQLFWKVQRDFLGGFDALAADHQVMVAYYVRPQHTSLEAAWRQWGYRTGWAPSRYLRHYSRQLDYFDTWQRVSDTAPRIGFVPRPFRADLLDNGDVVADFARRFLGGAALRANLATVRSNVGLPLEVVNLIRVVGEGLLWDSPHDNRRLTRLKSILANGNFEETEDAAKSRNVLQAYCYKRFEPGNRKLAAEMGWGSAPFVPEPDNPGNRKLAAEMGWGSAPFAPDPNARLDALDALWEPRASTPELEMMRGLLQHVFRDK